MLGHGNHHSFPETPTGDPAPGGTHSGHPRACTQPLFDPIPIPHLDPILGFLLKNRYLDVYCHSCRIGHEHRDRPKHCPLAHPRALYRTHTRVPKSGMYLWLVGAWNMHPVQQFCVSWRLATAVEIAWMVQAGSNLDESPFHAHWTECIHVSWNWMVIFTVLVRQRWFFSTIFKMQSFCSNWVKSAKNQHNLSLTDG